MVSDTGKVGEIGLNTNSSTRSKVNLKDYLELVETIAKVEYSKLSSNHLIDYTELTSIGTQTIHFLSKNADITQFNNSYISTAIKWAIRNEVRRRYRWYSLKSKRDMEETEQEDLRETVYKTILSIDEMADADNPVLIKDSAKNPAENAEFSELSKSIKEAMHVLTPREKELIENKFYKDKKLRELTEEFGISQSRISRIIQVALNKIKKELVKQDII